MVVMDGRPRVVDCLTSHGCRVMIVFCVSYYEGCGCSSYYLLCSINRAQQIEKYNHLLSISMSSESTEFLVSNK